MARTEQNDEIIFDEDDWSCDVDYDSNDLIITQYSKEGLAIAFCKVPLAGLAAKLKPFLTDGS